jgi:hypothetical protein
MENITVAGCDISGKSGFLSYLDSNGHKISSWHPYAKQVFTEVAGFPEKPDDFGLAVHQHINESEREFYLKKIFTLWNNHLQLETQESNGSPIFIDSGSQRMLIKEQTLYGNFKGNELLGCFPNPDLVFLIQLNVDLSWIWCKGKPEFYEMYPENRNNSISTEIRFKKFQTDVYYQMVQLYSDLGIPVVILPNTGVPSKVEKHKMWMEIISKYI